MLMLSAPDARHLMIFVFWHYIRESSRSRHMKLILRAQVLLLFVISGVFVIIISYYHHHHHFYFDT